MKNFEHPEFYLLYELQRLQEKCPGIPEIADLTQRTREIVNENARMMMKSAHMYVFLGHPADLSPETLEQLEALCQTGVETCRRLKAAGRSEDPGSGT